MRKSVYSGLLCMLALMVLSPLATAGSMRCGSHLIQDGQRNGPTKYEVLKKCGTPNEQGWDTWIDEASGGASYSPKFNDNGKLTALRKL
jgi:hypothetical protein